MTVTVQSVGLPKVLRQTGLLKLTVARLPLTLTAVYVGGASVGGGSGNSHVMTTLLLLP